MRSFLIFLAVLLISAFFIFSAQEKKYEYGSACFKDNCFSVEIPLTDESISRGLMFREHLDADRGMLFVFDRPDVYPFWMKNTLIPLDIIWINESMDVVFISRNTQPCKAVICNDIVPDKKAVYVLEINGGIADAIGLMEGEKIIIEKNHGFS